MAVRSSNGYVGFSKQVNQATDTAPTTFLRLAAVETLEQIQDVQEVRSLNADRELDAIYKTSHKPGGSFQTYARPGLGAQLLAYCLGADSITSVSPVYTHRITKANIIPWLTVERMLDNIERFIGCKINQIVISGSSAQPVFMDVSFMACDSEIESETTASYQTDEPFMFHDGTYTLDAVSYTHLTLPTILLV